MIKSKAQKQFEAAQRRAETDRQARQFAAMCEGAKLSAPVREHEFREGRGSAFDFAWVAHKVALEVEGAIFIQGAHNRPARFAGDMEKYNAAAAAGWLVLRCVPGFNDVTRWRTSKRTGQRTPTPIYSVPALCSFTTIRLVERAIDSRETAVGV